MSLEMGISKNLLKKFNNNLILKQLKLDSKEMIKNIENLDINNLQKNILNLYRPEYLSPFIPVNAKGPWIIGSKGEIVYDVGGYGMLGLGHNPDWSREILSNSYVMANVMTANIIQKEFTDNLMNHIGQNREKGCPYSKFAVLNSGSEAMELALRIGELNLSKKNPANIVIKKGFHGRTGNAAKISDSSLALYRKYLSSYQSQEPVFSIEMNNWHECLEKFRLISSKYDIQTVIAEPVMGEGDPGKMMSLQFYRLLRRLTKEHNSTLIIDSVQAGFRCTGFLSASDYYHLAREDPPDIEIFSKAINGGQFPVSVLATTDEIFQKYKYGIYGNTMSSNPRALAVCIEVLNQMTSEVQSNIRIMGKKLNESLQELKIKYPDFVTHVSGTGLLQAIHINHKYNVTELNGLEYLCRVNGLNVIHGGTNAIRLTPYFNINIEEIELIQNILDKTFEEYLLKQK